MNSLFYLYSRTIINEYRSKFFAKNVILGSLFLIIVSLFFLGAGLALGYLVIYLSGIPKFAKADPLRVAGLIFIELVLPMFLYKASYNIRPFRKFTLSTLKVFPVRRSSILLFDINVGLFDLASLFLFLLTIGLIISAGGFTYSFGVAAAFLILILTLVYLVHIAGELVQSIVRILGQLPKTGKVIYILIGIAAMLNFIYKWALFHTLLRNNPIAWNFNAVFSLTEHHQSQWIINIIILNALFSSSGLVLVVFIKLLHERLFSSHVLKKKSSVSNFKFQLPDVAKMFNEKLSIYLRKDFKYLLRSSRSISMLMLEFLLLGVIIFLHFNHSKMYVTFYVPAAYVIIFPLLAWDFFLSNIWGPEKRGFGFYLYSDVDYAYLIRSKNISYIMFRVPVILLISAAMGVIYSFKFVPVILVLYAVSFLMSLSFSNIVSIKAPYPVELKESPFSRNRPKNISLIGLTGLVSYIVIIGGLIFLLYEINTGVRYYLVILFILVLSSFFYQRMNGISAGLLNKQKETIHKKLLKI